MCRKTLFLTAAALLLSLSVGCGGPSAAQTEPPASPDPTAPPAASPRAPGGGGQIIPVNAITPVISIPVIIYVIFKGRK